MNSSRLTIIVPDKAVYMDAATYTDLNFKDCNIPPYVNVLQWVDGQGWIEYSAPELTNKVITELPQWALNCVAKWEEKHATM